MSVRSALRDGKVLADKVFAEFSVEDLVNLPAAASTSGSLIDGVVARGFSDVTVTPVSTAAFRSRTG